MWLRRQSRMPLLAANYDIALRHSKSSESKADSCYLSEQAHHG